MEIDRKIIIAMLLESNCKIVFQKLNGEERVMICTLDKSKLPQFDNKKDKQKIRKTNKSIISCFDLEKNHLKLKI